MRREGGRAGEEKREVEHGWMERESEEGRYCLVAGDAAASSNTAKRLTTLREARSERRGERRD